MRTYRRTQACHASSPLAIDHVNRIVLGDGLEEKDLSTVVEQRWLKALTTAWKKRWRRAKKIPNACGTRKSRIVWLQSRIPCCESWLFFMEQRLALAPNHDLLELSQSHCGSSRKIAWTSTILAR